MKKKTSALEEFLAVADHVQLRKFASYLVQPDHDRTLILNAHLVAEQLLEGIVSTALPRPNAFLENADFRGKLNLARALGLIGDHAIACCAVLNQARNSIAHSLDPLAEKWKVEMERLAYGKGSGIRWKQNRPKSFNETLRVLLALISGDWLRARFAGHLRKFRDNERWKDLMVEKAFINLDIFLGKDGREGEDRLEDEVDLELLRELKEKSGKGNANSPES